MLPSSASARLFQSICPAFERSRKLLNPAGFEQVSEFFLQPLNVVGRQWLPQADRQRVAHVSAGMINPIKLQHVPHRIVDR